MADKTTLWLRPEILSELMYYVWKVDAEVGGMGILSFEGNDIVVEELFLVEQEVHGTECELSSEAYSKLMASLMEDNEYDKLERLNFWWHSHKDMGAFFSATDDKTMLEWDGKYQVALVINRKMEMKAKVMSRVPVLLVGEIDVRIDWFDIPNEEILRQSVEEKVKKKSFQPQPGKAIEKYNGNQHFPGAYGSYLGYRIEDDDWEDDWKTFYVGKTEKRQHEMTEEEWKKALDEVDAEVSEYMGTQLCIDADMDEIEKATYKQWWREAD